MRKIIIIFAIILLTGCDLPQQSAEQAARPTIILPTRDVDEAIPSTLLASTEEVISATPEVLTPATQALVPTETVPPTETPPTLAHLAAGQEVIIIRLEMFDPLHGWALGGDSAHPDNIFTTADGGNTWRDVTPPQPGEPGTLHAAAFFLTPNMAWVTYSTLNGPMPPYPVVWNTVDGGLTWQPSQLLDLSGLEQFYASHLYFVDENNGWLLTHVGVGMSHDYVTLFRTHDGGLSWWRLLDPYTDGQIQACQKTGLLFLDAQNGWLTGDCGGVMAGVFLNRTYDGGVTWIYIDLPAPADDPLLFDVNTPAACGGYDLYFFDPSRAVLGVRCTLYLTSGDATFVNYLYTTADGGTTWSSTPYPGGTLQFVSPETGWALSREIYQTNDGGASWSLLNTVHWDALFDFIDPQVGWAASYADTEHALVQTSNGGGHWTMLEPVIVP